MIRASAWLACALFTAACSSLPGVDDARLTFRPQYYGLELHGDSSMQSSPGGGPIVDNAPNTVRSLAASDRDSDYGGALVYGNGFSGFEFGIMLLDQDNSKSGILTSDYGVLPAGSTVTSEFRLSEYRLGYTGQFATFQWENGFTVRAGAGATLSHRDGRFIVKERNTGVEQKTRFDDDATPFLTARLRGEYNNFSLTGDYGIAFVDIGGGELEPPMNDVLVTAAYRLVDQDITLLASYRWFELPASGDEGGLEFDHDFSMGGFVLGVEVTF